MARKGDLIVCDPARVGGPTREGEIIEVIEGDLRVRYRVRWNDGHESVLAPGAGAARIEPARGRTKARSRGAERKESRAEVSTAKKATVRKVAAKKATSRGPSGSR